MKGRTTHGTTSRGHVALEAVRTEGGLLPSDVLQRIASADREVPGLAPSDFHLVGHETISEAITRSWNRLLGVWSSFREQLAKVPDEDHATKLTQEKWLLPLFAELGFGRLTPAPEGSFVHGEQTFAISHLYHRSPIHLVGAHVDLEKRHPEAPGAKQASPHGLVQDFLNKSDDHLWAFVSNGLRLRLLRDHRALTRLAYVELDLEVIFEGELFHAFRLVWLLAHQSRVEAERPEECWLEKWHELVLKDGVAALDKLRRGVEDAIATFGRGFLAHPDNVALREALASGALDKQDYYRELLRLVYRLIFLFVTEDRGVLLDPDASPEARARYDRFYSTRRLRDLSRKRRGSAHADLWPSLRVVMQLVSGDPAHDERRRVLGLPALGSFLWSAQCIPHLQAAELSNEHLLAALRALSTTEDKKKQRYPVNWRSLGAEELGSVYESLLELHPEVSKDAASFELSSAAGHERKTTGSYYTPSELVECLLDTALDPVMEAALKDEQGKPKRGPDAEAALLALTVCDPACGSGHFLLAAARRLARRLAQIRADYAEPSPEETRHALRDVVSRCIFGVDLNPMAAELCKVSLWLEAVEPGRPLSFLDSHIQVGNSLLGTTPELMANGIPDDAWKPIEGDDKKVASSLKKRNKEEGRGQETLLSRFSAEAQSEADALKAAMTKLEAASDASSDALAQKERAWADVRASEAWKHQKLVADAWCAAFMWPKPADDTELVEAAPTNAVWRDLRDGRGAPPARLVETVEKIAAQHQFLHWHAAFPTVFERGGFDVVLGNPPWERVKLQEQEFFAPRHEAIANAPNSAARKRLIAQLPSTSPALWDEWTAASRKAAGESRLIRHSGRYPLCGKGDVNTYAIFAEHNRGILRGRGRAGFIVPTGVATDDTTKEFFGALSNDSWLISLFDFQSGPGLFGEIGHARFKFCLLTLGSNPGGADLLFFARNVAELSDPKRHFSLAPADFATLNPNTRTCPTFRSRRDADLNLTIYRRAGVLWREGPPEDNPWGLRFMRMLDMANDSGLFRERLELEASGWKLAGNHFIRGEERMLPLIEAKMVHLFDHRFGDYSDRAEGSQDTQLPDITVERLQSPLYGPKPRYWIVDREVSSRLDERWARGWLLGWRDICRSTDQRTVIASLVPRIAVNDKLLLMLPSVEPQVIACLCACMCSFVLDYAARQKVGGTNLKYFTMRQLPMLAPSVYAARAAWLGATTVRDWLLARVVELTYTAWDLEPFARDVGYEGPPYLWDPARRAILRAELDAAFFHLYGIAREDVDYILETFPIVRKNDEKAYGTYRTKELILDVYDRMQRAIDGGEPFETLLDPPPAHPSLRHGPTPWRTVRRTDRGRPAFDVRYGGGDVVELRVHDLDPAEQTRIEAHFGAPEWEEVEGEDGTSTRRLKLRGYVEHLARLHTLPAPFEVREG